MIRGWLRHKLAEQVTVHTTTDQTIIGYLEETSRDGLILRAARFMDAEVAVPLAGEVFVPREKIAFVQVGG